MTELDTLVPPAELIHVGPGDFQKIGADFLDHFIAYGGLQPADSVLDVGCGIGRMAVPLIGYLGNRGNYEGFDVVASGIQWCQEKISSRCPNFNFRHVDVYNKEYNPQGRLQAAEFRFPYGNASFDFVFLTSVFTHMLPADMEFYFSEIARVLKAGGRCLITYFLLNNESLQAIYSGQTELDFRHACGRYRVMNPDTPERVVAYEESHVLGCYERNGLKMRSPILYGSWCGRRHFVSYQDMIVAHKLAWN